MTCLALVAGLMPASAIAEVSLSVTPALLDVDGGAGNEGQLVITVSNRGDEAIDVVTALIPLDGADPERSAGAWLAAEPARLHLEPGDEKPVDVSLRIPADAASGSVYAAVSLSTLPPGVEATTGVSGRIVVPLLLTVDGDGRLERQPSLTRAALFVEPDGRFGARAEVRNDGNAHVPLEGSVTITAGDDSRSVLDFVGGRVLPETTRIYGVEGPLDLPHVPYEVEVLMAPPAEADLPDVAPLTSRLQVQTTDVRLSLDAAGVCLGSDGMPALTARLRNDTELGVVAGLSYEVRGADGTPLAQIAPRDEILAWPGTTTAQTIPLGAPLPDGAEQVVVTATWADGGADELVRHVTVSPTEPATTPPPC